MKANGKSIQINNKWIYLCTCLYIYLSECHCHEWRAIIGGCLLKHVQTGFPLLACRGICVCMIDRRSPVLSAVQVQHGRAQSFGRCISLCVPRILLEHRLPWPQIRQWDRSAQRWEVTKENQHFITLKSWNYKTWWCADCAQIIFRALSTNSSNVKLNLGLQIQWTPAK